MYPLLKKAFEERTIEMTDDNEWVKVDDIFRLALGTLAAAPFEKKLECMVKSIYHPLLKGKTPSQQFELLMALGVEFLKQHPRCPIEEMYK